MSFEKSRKTNKILSLVSSNKLKEKDELKSTENLPSANANHLWRGVTKAPPSDAAAHGRR